MKNICLRRKIHLLHYLLAYSPCVSSEIFFASLLKSVLPFLINQVVQFISRVISHSYFSANFLPSFLLWYDFRILVKGRWYILKSSIACKRLAEVFFFNWEVNIPSFFFVIWTQHFWIWFSRKLTKTVEISTVFLIFYYFPPAWLSSLVLDLSINNILRLGSDHTKIGS